MPPWPMSVDGKPPRAVLPELQVPQSAGQLAKMQTLTQQVWGGARGSAPLTIFRVILMLLSYGALRSSRKGFLPCRESPTKMNWLFFAIIMQRCAAGSCSCTTEIDNRRIKPAWAKLTRGGQEEVQKNPEPG